MTTLRWIGIGLLLCGCAPRLNVVVGGRSVPVSAFVADTPLAEGENIARRAIAHGEDSSLFLVRIRDREEPHLHARYDLGVLLVEGRGTLWVAGGPRPMKAGDFAFVPRGTPHYFVNEGAEPAAALATFSPRFTGPDNQPVAGR
jgi:mannose-6-phosphate isomerase-like protein (cupin superfamily)